jgi:hypothetical protein
VPLGLHSKKKQVDQRMVLIWPLLVLLRVPLGLHSKKKQVDQRTMLSWPLLMVRMRLN